MSTAAATLPASFPPGSIPVGGTAEWMAYKRGERAARDRELRFLKSLQAGGLKTLVPGALARLDERIKELEAIR